MAKMFGGGGQSFLQQAPPVAQALLPKPKITRMPTETDPSVLAAAQRTRRAALARKGRLSTIMTDANETIGSGGQALGA